MAGPELRPAAPRVPAAPPPAAPPPPSRAPIAAPTPGSAASGRAGALDRADGFERGTSGRAGSSPRAPGARAPRPSADPAREAALGAELAARRAADTPRPAAGRSAVYRPVVRQARGEGIDRAMTSRASTADQLADAARARPTPNGRLSEGVAPAEIETVRDGLRASRDELRAGDYGAAARRLGALETEHPMGFYGNGRLGEPGLRAAGTLRRQAELCRDMEAALGRRVSCPPSEADSRAWFRSFDSDARRPEARQAFERYNEAFYTHVGQVGGRDADVRYSRDRPAWVRDGRVFDRRADAGPDAREVETATPDQWRDVERRPLASLEAGRGEHAGRRIIDCEGYAYLSERLLGPGGAGYELTHVTAGDRSIAGRGDPRDLHAMTRLRDPSSGAGFTQSNDRTYATDFAGYQSVQTEAQRRDLGRSPVFFEAPTMREAQALSVEPPRRRRFELRGLE
jgi:hypothetical protein